MAERGKWKVRKLLRELKSEQRYAEAQATLRERRGDGSGVSFFDGYRNGLGFAIRTILDAEVGGDG